MDLTLGSERPGEHYKQTTSLIFRWMRDPETATPKALYRMLDGAGLLLTDARVEEIREAAYRAGREDAAKAIESPDSPLCDCPRLESTPTNWQTRAAVDHHCDCRAVEAVAIMLGAYSKTVHATQCVHGTEFDESYQPRTPQADGSQHTQDGGE